MNAKQTQNSKKHYLIWDLPIRIFHWGFICLLAALWYTSDQDNGLIELHMQLGFVALGLIIFRIVWGVFGTYHARFINFLPNKTQLLDYLKPDKDNPPKYVGHNPIGSLMVIGMLLLILTQAVSGLFINDDVFSAGPYNGVFSENFESIAKFLHVNGFDVLIAFSVLHIAAVFYYLFKKKHNLIRPMITGKKTSDDLNDSDGIKHSKLWLALILGLIVAGFVYWLVIINAPVIEEYYY